MGAPVFAAERIGKRFPGVTALDGVDLTCRAGEVHVLLGENGAGKSTLVAMLAGLLRPDSGRLLIDGRPVVLASPRLSLAAGIGVMLQHPGLVPSPSVTDNVALGQGAGWRRMPRRDLAVRIRAVAAEAGLACDPDARAGDLSLGERQQVGVVQALMRGTRLLVLDEVTAASTPDRAAAIGRLMRRSATQGLAVLWITHRIDEALAFGDRITVLRHGRKAGELEPGVRDRADATAAILALMFGDVPAARPALPARAAVRTLAAPALAVHGLQVADPRAPVRGIDLSLMPGDILGIAGIDGSGQAALAEALAGQRPSAAGTVLLDGLPLDGLGVGARRTRGLGYATDDRLGEGTVGALPVGLNLLLKDIGAPPFWRLGFARSSRIAAQARALIAAFDIRTPNAATPVGRLSGGNIQKVLLARELSRRMRVAILAKPTHGLDARNTRAIRDRIRAAAREGVAVLLISSDLDEILELADRIAVLADGRILATLPNDKAAAAIVGRLMGEAAA